MNWMCAFEVITDERKGRFVGAKAWVGDDLYVYLGPYQTIAEVRAFGRWCEAVEDRQLVRSLMWG